jgi:hypothetical protein
MEHHGSTMKSGITAFEVGSGAGTPKKVDDRSAKEGERPQ